MAPPFFTIGHSDRTFGEFAALLHEAAVEVVVDVRKLPGSRRNPQFDEDVLARALRNVGVRYSRIAELGGRRPVAGNTSPEVNGFWRNRGFHNYADHGLSAEFGSGLARLREAGEDHRAAVMCSEAVWWRCHRRLIADHLLAHGDEVFHIMAAHRVDAARLTSGAVVHDDRTVTYPARPPSTDGHGAARTEESHRG
ncbi:MULTISPECIES: DUF488 domain-containing protein [Nocardiopsis]|uniref:DNA repair protein n=1 Tax=Nocardiopsis sinuspersici TaxID=501010 RepID=A0A1V3C2C1_9ACTN|nr:MULTISPECIES: DUF488 domain-containing protein [Nocardiopsis]OOC54875.1 hypothetical protein NOSIN_14590 [Nocardiopsis sinuspersici]